MIYFTSDTHYGHVNILEYCNRPFQDVNHMHEALISNYNEMVANTDTVYFLGDMVMGKFEQNINVISRLNGTKILIPGNHDRVWSGLNVKHIERFKPAYEAVFDEIHYIGTLDIELNGNKYHLCHFPPYGDSHDSDRFDWARPKLSAIEKDRWILHGHTHSSSKIDVANRSVHVGVDAWDYAPVSLSTVETLISDHKNL